MRISDLEGGYYSWARFDKARAVSTLAKYKECIGIFKNHIGNLHVRKIKPEHFDQIKKVFFERGRGRARVASIVYSMKSFLKYCRDIRGYRILEIEKVRVPPQEKYRIIQTLEKDEIRRLMKNIKLINEWEGNRRKRNINLHGLRWKCLIEVLWSSGMRISEALSLNRDIVDMQNREAIIIGKGAKYRKVFFSKEAIRLIKKYLHTRHDNHEALFVTHCAARRWTTGGAQEYMNRWRRDLKVSKHITFHTLRRSFASLIFYEKDIYAASKLLGHSDIETTRRHYICEDWEKLKEIHHAAVEK